jgi:CMP-N-acetylneuraminic acid synthetase
MSAFRSAVSWLGRLTSLYICSLLLSSCSSLLTSTVIEPAMSNLQQQSDLDLVCEGAPAYLLMIDSLLANSPEDTTLLQNAIKAYSSYSGVLPECDKPRREPAIAEKAKRYGLQLLTLAIGSEPLRNHELLDQVLAKLDKSDVPDVFWGTFGWLTWVKSSGGSPAALVDLMAIEKIMARLQELDETYENGAIPMFFGIYQATKPAMFGGREDLARENFEKALRLSKHRFLLVQTTYAETLARNTLDKELYDRLLREVEAFDINSAPEYTLANIIAKKKAERLRADHYFDD